MSVKCNPRHVLGKNFKCMNCKKSSQQCEDDFEPVEFACGCFDVMISKNSTMLIQCRVHVTESMWEI